MKKNDAHRDNGMKAEFGKSCKITEVLSKEIFEDLVHFNNVINFLFEIDNPVAHRVMHKLFPNGKPSPDEFLKTIVKKLSKPEDLERIIRETKGE